MTSKWIAVGILGMTMSVVAVADEKSDMKKNRDPMTEEPASRMPENEPKSSSRHDNSESKVAQAACAKLSGAAKEACVADIKGTYGIAPFGSKKRHKGFGDESTRFGRT